MQWMKTASRARWRAAAALVALLSVPVMIAPAAQAAETQDRDLASAASGAPRAWFPSVAGDAGLASRAESSAAVVLESYISNQSSIGQGVMSLMDGVYDSGLYDAILPPGWRTDIQFRWNYAHGAYIGPGGCAKFRSWTGTYWYDYGNHPAGQWYLPPNPWGQDVTRWEIRNC